MAKTNFVYLFLGGIIWVWLLTGTFINQYFPSFHYQVGQNIPPTEEFFFKFLTYLGKILKYQVQRI